MLIVGAAPEELPPPAAGGEEVRKAAEEILSRPEFQEPPRSLYERALDFVGDRIGDFLNALLTGGRGALFGWLVITLLVVGGGYLVYRALNTGSARGRRSESDDAASVEQPRPAAAWSVEADALEARGEWRAAMRCRHRALIAELARTGVIDEVPGRTAGEYRLAVRGALPASDVAIDPATDLFERAWYGNQPTGAGDVGTFKDLAARVLATSRRPKVGAQS